MVTESTWPCVLLAIWRRKRSRERRGGRKEKEKGERKKRKKSGKGKKENKIKEKEEERERESPQLCAFSTSIKRYFLLLPRRRWTSITYEDHFATSSKITYVYSEQAYNPNDWLFAFTTVAYINIRFKSMPFE